MQKSVFAFCFLGLGAILVKKRNNVCFVPPNETSTTIIVPIEGLSLYWSLLVLNDNKNDGLQGNTSAQRDTGERNETTQFMP